MVLDTDYDQKGLVKMAPKALLHITLCFSVLYAWYYIYNNYGKQKAYIEFDDDDRQG